MKKMGNKILVKTLVISAVVLFLLSSISTAENGAESQELGLAKKITSHDLNEIIYEPNIKIIEFGYPVVNLDVSTDKENYFVGDGVEITIENNCDKTVYFYGPSYHWIIEKYTTDGKWERSYPCWFELCIFLKTQINPGEREVDIWNQKTCNSISSKKDVQAPSGYYRVVVRYSMDEDGNEPFFTKYAYFAIDNIYKIPTVRYSKINISKTIIIPFPPVYVENNLIYFRKIPSVITIPIDEINTIPLQKTIIIPLPQMATVPIDKMMTISADKISTSIYCNAIVQHVPEEITVKLSTNNNDLLDPPVVTLPDKEISLYEPPLTFELSNPSYQKIFWLPQLEVIYLPPQVEVIKMPPVEAIEMPGTIAVPYPEPIVVPLPPIIWSETGEVRYIDLECGFYGIVSDNGRCYDPINLPSEFKNDGLQINFKVKVLENQISFHMWGTIVEILEIGAMP
jgi:hypothetical protein